MASRMIIPVSFKDKEDYEYVKSMPNSSHYIRELVKKDRLKQKENNIEKKVEEILNKKLKQLDFKPNDDTKENLLSEVQNIFNTFND